MTGKSDFTEQEWDTVLQGAAGRRADRGRGDEGRDVQGELRDREVLRARRASSTARASCSTRSSSAKPEVEHHLYHSVRRDQGSRPRSTYATPSACSRRKATPDEVNDYRKFVLTLSDHVANAHREHGAAVSDAEQAAIADITAALGGDGS